MDEEEYEGIAPEDEFASGDDIVMWSDRGIELGFLLGFSDHGVIWRRTHSTVKTGTGPDDWDFVALNRSILTFLRWDRIDRLESHEEIAQEHELGKFAELMDEVNDAEDFAIVTEVADEEKG